MGGGAVRYAPADGIRLGSNTLTAHRARFIVPEYSTYGFDGDEMAAKPKTNVVNLDALIPRADFVANGMMQHPFCNSTYAN